MLASALSLLSGGGASAAQQARYHKNAFPPGERLDLRVYLSERPRFRDFNNTEPIWHVSGLLHANDAPQQSTTVQVPVTGHLIANGSLFAHAFITREGRSPDPAATGSYDPWATTTLTQALVVHGARPEPLGLRKLTTGEPAPWEEELRRGAVAAAIAGQPPDRWVPHWKPALHLSLIVDFEPHELFRGMPPHYQHHLLQRRLMDRDGTYKPLLYSNELTVMRQHWLAINDSAVSPTELPLELSWSPMGVKRFAWMQQLEASFKMNEDKLGISEKESEDMRGMFVHTPPALLYTTMGVSAVHLLFDVLAFQSDLSFWRGMETMEGLSSRALLLNQAMELVVLLYLIEEGSSWLVQDTLVVGSAFTLILGFFKIIKSVQVRKEDKERTGGVESLTEKYDRLAFRYLLLPLLLLVAGYSVYCLLTWYYRSWYSWLLESLVALVYGCGFIVMTPQLFINWRLKSVAHLPWKFFMYKAMNTFIDDLFAFIIKMPTLHRMSCFRDDIVFAIFMYQRYVYKVDLTRVNEYGTRGDGVPNGDGAQDGDGGGDPSKSKRIKKRSKKTD